MLDKALVAISTSIERANRDPKISQVIVLCALYAACSFCVSLKNGVASCILLYILLFCLLLGFEK